jgi:multiple sugar transport system substrate-binding protein
MGLVLWLAACGGAAEPTATAEPVELRLITFGVLGPIEQALIERFEASYPHIQINLEEYNQPPEEYLAQTSPPDLLALVPGVRLTGAVDQGLVTDITELWQEAELDERYPATLSNLGERGGKQYLLPILYTWNAIYYNKQVFEQYNLQPPHTWDEFVMLCDTLLNNGETPLVWSADDAFMSSLWIDYFNLRLNGVEFQQQLNNGEISYQDDRVRAIFTTWYSLMERGYFGENAHYLDTESALAAIVRNEASELAGDNAVMMLTGPVFLGGLAESSRDALGFFAFPVIDSTLPVGEVVFAVGYVIPSAAAHRVEALTFLSYLTSDAALELLSQEANTNSLYVPAFAAPDHENLPATVRQGITLIQQADAVTSAYGLDIPDRMQQVMDRVVRRFVFDPQSDQSFDLEAIVSQLEAARQAP